ncbi:MAG: class I SAM-dependent methyltransferase [Pseudomonadota bacterium]|nr:class I SAM-dependent methyltransferase [Pseudomonadota bacterium]
MADSDSLLPKSSVPGLIPTLNYTGWMTEKLDRYSADFAQYAGTVNNSVLDIGCAYGVATLVALKNGARVLASDMEPAHLEILTKRVPKRDRERLRTQTSTLPNSDFPTADFDAILAARVLHFLNGDDIRLSVSKMFNWLRPKGRLYLVTDSPYIGPWACHAQRYEERKNSGHEWPGFVEDYRSLLPASSNPNKQKEFINPLDPDILTRECINAGFKVISAEFLPGSTKHAKGKEHAGIIAFKP